MSFNTTSWVALRWERGDRYYRTHLEQDLWGKWTLTRVVGRKGAPRGRYMTSWVASLEDGLMTLGAIGKRRRERGFRLVGEAKEPNTHRVCPTKHLASFGDQALQVE